MCHFSLIVFKILSSVFKSLIMMCVDTDLEGLSFLGLAQLLESRGLSFVKYG